MSDFPLDLINKILRMSSDESHRSFCRMKLVSKDALTGAPFQLRFDSIQDFYTHNADKYTISQLQNPDNVEMVDFLSQFKIMVAEKAHLYPGLFSWIYSTVLKSYIGGGLHFSCEELEDTRARTLGNVRDMLRKSGWKE